MSNGRQSLELSDCPSNSYFGLFLRTSSILIQPMSDLSKLLVKIYHGQYQYIDFFLVCRNKLGFIELFLDFLETLLDFSLGSACQLHHSLS